MNVIADLKYAQKSFDQTISDELSFKTKQAFSIALQGRWLDNGSVPVDPAALQRDVSSLKNALNGSEEMLVCSILFARSPVFIQALTAEYKKVNKRASLTHMIKSVFSGHLKEALLFAVEGGKHDGTGVWRDAKRLEKSMAGMGTDERSLIMRTVRGHWNVRRWTVCFAPLLCERMKLISGFEQDIQMAYKDKYKKKKKSLHARIAGETSGDRALCLTQYCRID